MCHTQGLDLLGVLLHNINSTTRPATSDLAYGIKGRLGRILVVDVWHLRLPITTRKITVMTSTLGRVLTVISVCYVRWGINRCYDIPSQWQIHTDLGSVVTSRTRDGILRLDPWSLGHSERRRRDIYEHTKKTSNPSDWNEQ